MKTIGRYRVLRPLGHGGMGLVFLAHDPTLERDVALKLLHRQAGHSGLRDEAKALAALSHPGIVTVFEIGEHEGQDFIAMEYLPGRSLREVLAANTASRDELLAICAKVAGAVAAAHAAGILHRDIKPENVVVADNGEVKVVDFGLARRLEREGRTTGTVTASEVVEVFRRTLPPDAAFGGVDTEVSAGTQTMFGTPAYMAPEVLLGEPSTRASDIYSLGITLHECLAGRRPYTATSLVEVIAQTIEGPPQRLDDPLGPLVDRMLARDPAQRPSLVEVARALVRKATVPSAAKPARRAWPIPLAALVVTAGLGATAWWYTHRAPAFVSTSIAVAPFTFTMPSYGVEPPTPASIADVISRLVGEVGGARLVGITTSTQESSVDATYLVRGTITEDHGVLRATLQMTDVATHGPIATHGLSRPAPELAPLLDDVAGEIARVIAPGAELDRAHNRLRAQMFARLGAPIVEAGRFTDARPYVEQAVDADPSLFEGWYTLGLVLAWMEAPEDQVRAATDRALGLAPPGPKHELMRGIAAFLAGDFGGARAALEPLEKLTGPTAPDPRELLYYLGEANWHDGRHAAAFAQFVRVLKANPRFKPATVHAWEYAVIHKDVPNARYYVGLAGESPDWIEHATGNYAQLATTGSPQHALEAKLVLGQLDGPELAAKLAADDLDGASYRVAVAIAHDDRPAAKAAFAAAWAKVSANHDPTAEPGIVYGLEGLGEVVITAELTDEARLVVAYLAARSTDHPARNYHRFSILTAQLTRDRALIVRDHGSERMRWLADAIEAGLGGDHVAAAKRLRTLIDDPTFSFDYPERAALLRELLSIPRDADAVPLCAELDAPPIVRPAFLALRAACQRKFGHP